MRRRSDHRQRAPIGSGDARGPLRSNSDHAVVAAHRDVLHKIGVTGGDIARRIANAKLDPTFLMADVEVVATYELFNINRTRLENLIHRVFGVARLDIEIKDSFGQPTVPREWFLVPLFVVDEAIEKIRDGTITTCRGWRGRRRGSTN
jgi:Meiotically up-regulated gene 113